MLMSKNVNNDVMMNPPILHPNIFGYVNSLYHIAHPLESSLVRQYATKNYTMFSYTFSFVWVYKLTTKFEQPLQWSSVIFQIRFSGV